MDLNSENIISGDELIERFAYGTIALIFLFFALLILGTETGRSLLIFVVFVILVLFCLGWLVEVGKETYEKYSQ